MQSFAQTIQKDVHAFTDLRPEIKFVLVFQLLILFTLSILVGILFSPHFKPQLRNQSQNSTIVYHDAS
jgi:hypothetical protein